MEQKLNVLTLKPLYIIAKYLGIWPSFDIETMEKCGCDYLYGGIILTLIVFHCIFWEYNKIWYSASIDTSVFITIYLSDFATTLVNISSIVNINFMQGKRLHKFVQDLKQIIQVMKHVKMDDRNERRNFYIQLVIGHILYALFMWYNVWHWTHKFGWQLGKRALIRDVQFYHILITTLLIRNFVQLIMYKLHELNYVLENHNVDNLFVIAKNVLPTCNYYSYNNGINKVNADWDLDTIGKTYTKLSSIIHEFNEIFGWNLVVLEIQLIINILLPLNFLLVYGHGEEFLGVIVDYKAMILCFIWFIIPMVQMMPVLTACDRAKNEASKMPMICHKLILENKNAMYINQLKDLAIQGNIQSPVFSAAGFFNFDYTLIFPTMTTLISYVIVLIQLRK